MAEMFFPNIWTGLPKKISELHLKAEEERKQNLLS